MIKYLSTLLTIVLILSACNSGESPKKKLPAEQAVESKQKQIVPSPSSAERVTLATIEQSAKDQLLLRYTDGSEATYACQGSCEYLLSPDKSALAINTSVLSNLSIAEIFRVDAHGKIDFKNAENLSAKVWDLIGMMHNINVEDVERPRTAVMGWDSDRVLEVLVQGSAGDGVEIDEVVRMEISQ